MNKITAIILVAFSLLISGCDETVTGPSIAPTHTSTLTLDVYGGDQAPDGIAFQNGVIMFTEITLTAISGDIPIYGILVERTGYSVNDPFLGVSLFDENCNDVDAPILLNASNQAMVGGSFVLPQGTSRTFQIGTIMASDLSLYAGQIATLVVVDIITPATLSGDLLPITGSTHTVSSTYVPTDTILCNP